MLKFILLTAVCLLISLILVVQCKKENNLYSPALQNKLKQKIKHDLHKKRGNKNTANCENIHDWHPKVKSEKFLLAGTDRISSLNSFPPTDNCTIETLEIKWHYEFFSSMHCIKIVLDLGPNVTYFTNKFNYSYYGFTYRELGKTNLYMPRHVINESNNTLIITNVNYHPYIVCVTFYKNPFVSKILSGTEDEFSFNYTISDEIGNDTLVDTISCAVYSNMFVEDTQSHDLNLCIDIDTHETFFFEVQNDHGIRNPKFIMAAFMMVLIGFMLSVIAFATYSLRKIKEKQYMERIGPYIQHIIEHIHHHNSEKRSSKSTGSIASRHMSLAENKINKVVANETERFIVTKAKVSLPDTSLDDLGKVTFELGDDYGGFEHRFTSADDDETDMAVAHLLDDKPWARTRYSIASRSQLNKN
jgi:hypothetical protein